MIGSLLMMTMSVLGLYAINRGPAMCPASPPTYTPTFSFTPAPAPGPRAVAVAVAVAAATAASNMTCGWLLDYSASASTKQMPVVKLQHKTMQTATKGAIVLSYIIVVLRLTYLNLP